MQPSSDRTEQSNPALRRWGPLVAIVVVVAVVAGVVLLAGDDDDTDDGPTDGGTDNGQAIDEDLEPTTEPPEGAITWERAQEEGLDVTFPDTCDSETGRLALPYYFTPECYADAEAQTTDGTRGVTDDTIKIVVHLTQDADPIYNFVTAPLNVDDDNDDVRATYQGYVDMYNEYAQLYGRQVELEFLESSSVINDEVGARADAVRAMTEMDAFAVVGGPLLANAWTEEVHAREGICLACPPIADPEPYVMSVTPSTDQSRAQFVEWLTTKVAGKPAEHAGDEALHETERVFGHLYIDTGDAAAQEDAERVRELLADEDVELVEQIGYELDPAAMQEQAGSAIARFQAAGVTSIIYNADPIGPISFTQEASRQDYYPEWIIAPSVLADTAAFARTYEQEQWANAFGISALPTRATPDVNAAYVLYEWYHGRPPEADDTAQLLYPNMALLFAGLQAAGPDLTPTTFRDGLFSLRTLGRAISQPLVTFGYRGIWDDWSDEVTIPDYYGIDDFVEIWWDAEEEGPDEIFNDGTGMYRYVDGGQRYLPGEWTDELRAFDPSDTITIIEDLPADEQPPEYPSP